MNSEKLLNYYQFLQVDFNHFFLFFLIHVDGIHTVFIFDWSVSDR